MELLLQQVLLLGKITKNLLGEKKRKTIFFCFSPSGEVTVLVSGKNYSIPQFELPLLNKVNNSWTVGPYLVAINQTNLYPIQS